MAINQSDSSLKQLLHGGVDPISDPAQRSNAGHLGMVLFLISLAMLFATVVLAYVVVGLQLAQADDWRPAGAPGLPSVLILSTILLLGSSLTLGLASRSAARGGGPSEVGRWMLLTLCLVAGFLVTQGIAWVDLVEKDLLFQSSLYAWLFYVLTGVHALHVLGGIVPLCIVTRNAFKGRYSTRRFSRRGLIYCGMYWHFIDVAWLILYLTLFWGMGG